MVVRKQQSPTKPSKALMELKAMMAKIREQLSLLDKKK